MRPPRAGYLLGVWAEGNVSGMIHPPTCPACGAERIIEFGWKSRYACGTLVYMADISRSHACRKVTRPAPWWRRGK
jgi:ribosomal protein S27AE